MTTIVAPGGLYRAAREHLRGHVEQVGFFLADFDAGRGAFVLGEWRPMPPEAFELQSAYHVSLRDEVRPEIIKWAWDAGACLVEVHSHGDEGLARFSPSDMWGFDEWVPHVRWRLRGRPYAAVVTAGDSFDALGWLDGRHELSQVEQLEVDGAVCRATGRTLAHGLTQRTPTVADERYSRNEGLFGWQGQRKIAETRVTIVGLGGLGSHVVQQLAYLGVRDYRVIDPDVVTDSSMNRLIGAVDADVAAGTKKIDVGAHIITAITPEADVEPIDATIEALEAEAAIAAADVVFGCLDRDSPRLKLTELCARHAKPLFDLASDTGGEGDECWYGGRVVFANGAGCLVCHDLLDQEEIARDSMSPHQWEAHDRIYGIKRGALAGTGPMVVSVNGTVASLAVTEFMVFVTGMRPPAPQLIYRGEIPVVRRVVDDPESGCYFCTRLWGTAAL